MNKLFKQKIILVAFGVFLSMILLEIVIRVGGFIYLSIQENRNKIELKKEGIRILCLGESTTAPMSLDFSYPAQLQDMLNKHEKNISYRVINEGVCGITTAEILFRLDDQLKKYKPHMIILLAGTNDSGLTMKYQDTFFDKTITFFQGLRTYKLLIAGSVKFFKYKFLNRKNHRNKKKKSLMLFSC